MSAKKMRAFWPFSPCPETHHEVSREDAAMKAIRSRFAHLTVEEIQNDLVGSGFTSEEIYNATKAVVILDGDIKGDE